MYFIKTKQLSYNKISAEEIQMSCVIEQIKTGLSYSFFHCTKAQQHRIFQIISIGGLSSANKFWQDCPLLNIPIGICHLCQISPQFGSGAGRWR